MVRVLRWMLAVGTIALLFPPFAVHGGGKDEMVANPLYKYWANFKPGATVTRSEKTVFGGPEKNTVPDGIDKKEVTYKLLEVTPNHVVVQVTVKEWSYLSANELAPTKQTFASKIKKSHLKAGLHEVDVKLGKDTMDVLGKKLDCVTMSGKQKKDNTEIDHTVWFAEQVPGGMVKHRRITKVDGKDYADTTITVKSYKAAD